MKNHWQKLLTLFLIAAVSSCSTSDSKTSGVIMPLKTGNHWTFVDSLFNTSGVFVGADTSTLSITGQKTVNYQSTPYDVFLWTWVDPHLAGFSWLAWYGDDGLYMLGGTSPKGDYVLCKSHEVQYPVNVNEQWDAYSISVSTFDSVFHIRDTVTMTCTSTNTPFPTPVQNFTCYTFQYTWIVPSKAVSPMASRSRYSKPGSANVPSVTTLYYAPDIGYVGLTDHENGILTYKKTLLSYAVNP
jgi:hypothetical protein